MNTSLARLLAAAAATLLAGSLAAPVPAAAAPAWQTSASSWTNPSGGLPRILDLRHATHAGYDRVVVDVRGKLPSYALRYQRQFTYDGSGARVPIRGGLSLVFNPAYAHTDAGASTYDGPRLARPGYPTLKAVAFTGDYEGYVSFGLGMSRCDDGTRAPYRVWRLHDPQRIVVDVRHC